MNLNPTTYISPVKSEILRLTTSATQWKSRGAKTNREKGQPRFTKLVNNADESALDPIISSSGATGYKQERSQPSDKRSASNQESSISGDLVDWGDLQEKSPQLNHYNILSRWHENQNYESSKEKEITGTNRNKPVPFRNPNVIYDFKSVFYNFGIYFWIYIGIQAASAAFLGQALSGVFRLPGTFWILLLWLLCLSADFAIFAINRGRNSQVLFLPAAALTGIMALPALLAWMIFSIKTYLI